MEQTFNMGVGMVAVLPADDVDRALAVLTARHVPAWVLGEVRRGRGVELVGEHPRVLSRCRSRTYSRSIGGCRAVAGPRRNSWAGRPRPPVTSRSVGSRKPGVPVTLRWKLRGSSSVPHTAS